MSARTGKLVRKIGGGNGDCGNGDCNGGGPQIKTQLKPGDLINKTSLM